MLLLTGLGLLGAEGGHDPERGPANTYTVLREGLDTDPRVFILVAASRVISAHPSFALVEAKKIPSMNHAKGPEDKFVRNKS